MKNKKIITLIICVLLVIIITCIGIVPEVISYIKVKDNYYKVEEYIIDNDVEYYEDEPTSKIVTSKELYETYAERFNIDIDEEEIEDKDFSKTNYIIAIIPINSCGEEIEFKKVDIEEENYLVYLSFDVNEKCGVCAPTFQVFEIAVPKKIGYAYDVKFKFITNEASCSPMVAYKPVLYLYPTQTTNIKVNFKYEENLTTTYPKFNKEWNVIVDHNGNLYDSDNNYYYALYWEEKDYTNVDFSEGFYVSKDNSIKFLEEKLSLLGLNNKERNEFIMYWLPILEKNEHNLVYFELTNELQNQNELIIQPKPDTLIRIRMHVKKVDKETNIKEQILSKQVRNGYTAIEWGGVIHN